MMFSIRVVILSAFFLFCVLTLVESQQCERCRPRDFKKMKTCTCPEKQYCDPSNGKCSKCNQCYNFYDDILNKKKKDIADIVDAVVEKYLAYLDEFQKLHKLLLDLMSINENELNHLDRMFDNVVGKNLVAQNLNKLKNDVKMIEEKLKNVGLLGDVLAKLKPLQKQAQELLVRLENKKSGEKTINLKTLEDVIHGMNENFPTVQNDTDSRSLSLSVEADIDLLNLLLLTYSNDYRNYSDISKSWWKNTQWIERDLFWLFSLIHNYHNVSFDIDRLLRNATGVKLAAEETKSKLEVLLKKHNELEELWKKLQTEVNFYEDVEKLKNRLEAASTKLRELSDNVNIIRTGLNENLSEFQKKKDFLSQKEMEKRNWKSKMDYLLDEGTKLIQKLKKTKHLDTIDNLGKEISIMIEEIKNIQNKIAHCLLNQ